MREEEERTAGPRTITTRQDPFQILTLESVITKAATALQCPQGRTHRFDIQNTLYLLKSHVYILAFVWTGWVFVLSFVWIPLSGQTQLDHYVSEDDVGVVDDDEEEDDEDLQAEDHFLDCKVKFLAQLWFGPHCSLRYSLRNNE